MGRIGASLCAAFTPLVVAADPTLRELASKLGVYVGSALNQACIQNTSDPDYATVSLQQYDLATAENECKFAQTEPSQGVFDYAGCDFVSNYMLKNGSGVFRGHNMVWGEDNPSWLLNGGFSPSELEGIMQAHISALGGRYKDSFFCFDVVNEAVADSGNETLKPSPPWYPAIPNYVDLAFQYARAAMPNVKLFYNDYDGEAMGATESAPGAATSKSDKIYAMVASMRARGIPIDGVGLQMHISVDGYPSADAVAANIQRLGALGLDVHITEMDVACKPPCGADRLALQAQIYGDILGACLGQPACKSFETWGFTDLHTWLWSFDNPTHENMQPLPFDVAYAPKPAFNAMVAKLQAALRARSGTSAAQ